MEIRGGDYGTHYDMESRHAGKHYGPKCPGCRLHTEASEGYVCWTPKCPCRGMDSTSQDSLDRAARNARDMLSPRSASPGAYVPGPAESLAVESGRAYAEARAEREEAAEYRSARAREVRNPDEALRWLADHVHVAHEYGG